MKWLSRITKNIYRVLGLPLTIFFTAMISAVILLGIISRLPYQSQVGLGLPILDDTPNQINPWYQNISIFEMFGYFVNILILLAFVLGLLYFIAGCITYFFPRFIRKKKSKPKPASIMIWRGIIGIVLAFLFDIILNLEWDLFFKIHI